MNPLQRLAQWLAADWCRSANLASNQVALADGGRIIRGQASTLEAALGDALDRWELGNDPQRMNTEDSPTTRRSISP